MFRRALLPLLALPGCAALGIQPQRQAVPPAPPPPRRADPVAAKTRPRQGPWTTRFWEELTPAQRGRVLARMRREAAETSPADAAARWDTMGLPEREGLLGGTGAVVVRQ